ncbi:hypothetical protein VTJ49DRAFT_2154 [Mycothermus thermophilus]|uniref:Uncharacterized protein n=1 Tax=Humicola insolens TaxID=85995 RepID=A0ABR3VNK6_HUMIN
MQAPDDAHLTRDPAVQPLPPAASAVRLTKARQSLASDTHPLAQSEASLPHVPAVTVPIRERRHTPSAAAASLFRSTLTPPASRSASPTPSSLSASSLRSPTLSPSAMTSTTTLPLAGSVFGSLTSGAAASKAQSLVDSAAADNPGDPLGLLLRSFVPHIAVHASDDADGLARDKGFAGGLWELLCPFGERVQGRVVVRDSNGAARSWDGFAVRFVRFGEGIEDPEVSANGQRAAAMIGRQGSASERMLPQVEAVVERHLRFAEEAYVGSPPSPSATPTREGLDDAHATSPYYALYLRRLLSGIPLSSHESFAHPVACVMAISSRNPAPIDALQRLYRETTSQGGRGLPPWVDGDYLRYYVLVHDEENGDITKSMALFDQMKRHFGLHCHLLRLRSTQSAETDDDSIPLPRSDWMTAAEELADIEASDARGDDFEDPTRYIFESDATAIRTFVREMVAQSVVPTMERNVSVWNDQVASRRRGISGRFMSLSKRWTAFGSSSRSGSAGSSGSGSSSNYDAAGFYRADSPEAIMRRLADYAFMLRDWKLAMSTYDLLRTDFQNDRAWKYHAAANEMCALALLIMPQNMSSRTRLETITQMLEQAVYSYHIRCGSLYGAVRCILLALELLRLRDGSGIDEAVRWGVRMLESRMTGPVGEALLRERLAVCYASKFGAGSQAWGSRRRKSALWSVLAAESWVAQAKYVQAQRCLAAARRMYALLPGECGVQSFCAASDFLAHLHERIKMGLAPEVISGQGSTFLGGASGGGQQMQGAGEHVVDEESETLGGKRSRRASLIGPPAGGGAGIETAPLSNMQSAGASRGEGMRDDGFG